MGWVFFEDVSEVMTSCTTVEHGLDCVTLPYHTDLFLILIRRLVQ
jgi:hypothetical protein